MNKRSATLKRLRNKADALIQEVTRLEFPNCEVCAKPTQAGHHFFTKAASAELRYDRDNLVAVCNGCHLKHHKGHPEIHAKVMQERGVEWYEGLLSRKSTIRTRNVAYYESVIARLEARLETVMEGV